MVKKTELDYAYQLKASYLSLTCPVSHSCKQTDQESNFALMG
ncbi:MAG: hypothetical protein WCP85_24480 [Mariniphaga sp.]